MIKIEVITQKNCFLLIIISLFLILLAANAQVAYGGCCVSSDAIDAYCIEFDDAQLAEDAGCDPGGYIPDKPCELTECDNFGCCVTNNCEWSQKGDCFGAFIAFTPCITECLPTCCIYNGIYYENIPQADCPVSSNADFYNKPCAEVMVGLYGSLEGNVESDTGVTLSNVHVYIGPYHRVTDGAGSFNFNSLPVSDFSVEAYKTGYQLMLPNPAEVTISQGDNQLTIVMTEDPNAVVTIRGKVEDERGNAVDLATVFIADPYASTRTDAFGYYTLRVNIPIADSYDITATKAGYQSNTQTLSLQAGNIYDSINFVISEIPGQGTCGDGIRDADEDCDPPDDYNCPGKCAPDCKCPLLCEERGFYCADLGYQCTNLDPGGIIPEFNEDCWTVFNNNNGVCCRSEPPPLLECVYGETGSPIEETDVTGSGGTFCRCGDEIIDSDGPDGQKYCCLVDNERISQLDPCALPGSLYGTVSAEGGGFLDDVAIQLAGTTYYAQTDSNGEYEIQNVAPGDYTLKATRVSYSEYVSKGMITIPENTAVEHSFTMMLPTGSDLELQLEVLHVKGLAQGLLKITASSIAAIQYYVIYRDSVQIAILDKNNYPDFDTVTFFTDYGLQWDEEYDYEVKAFSPGPTERASATVLGFNPGNRACKDVMDEYEFCTSEECYNFKTCSIRQDPRSPYYDDYLPKRYRIKCNAQNKMRYATGRESDSLCTAGNCFSVNQFLTICADPTATYCETLGLPGSTEADYTSETGNIFGLFYDKEYAGETCTIRPAGEPYKFCYYDYFYSDVLSRMTGSYTTVDQCLSCDPEGLCYDYQSEEACLTDNCRFGDTYNTECKWFPTYPSVGRGICYAEDITSDDYCEFCDRDNPIFYNMECTQDICSLLGSCVPGPGFQTCTACNSQIDCDYFSNDQAACEGNSQGYKFTGPYWQQTNCNSSISIEYSDDSCDLRFCRYMDSGLCIKDANYDDQEDCEEDTYDDCKLDREVPSSEFLSPMVVSSVADTIYFGVSGDYNPRLMYCFADQGSFCCPDKHAESNYIMFPNPYYDFIGIEGWKSLWYYSVTDYGVPEPIKSTDIYFDTKPPLINVEYEVVNSTQGTQLSEIHITITTDELAQQCNDRLSGPSSDRRLTDAIIDPNNPADYPMVLAPFGPLEDGNYIYTITCEDSQGNVNNTVEVQIEVDRIKLIVDPYPNFMTLADSHLDFSIRTLGKQYYCFYEMLEPSATGTEVPYEEIQQQGKNYNYYSRNKHDEIKDTNKYNYKITCYEDAAKTVQADTSSMLFTIDKTPPVSSVRIRDDQGYVEIDPNAFYSRPVFMINCSDPVLGPPREFGCSDLYYCFGSSICPDPESDGIHESSDYVVYQPNLEVSGDYYICSKSEDLGGNKEQFGSNKCILMKIDVDGPGLTIDTPFNGFVLGKGQTFVFSGKWQDEQKPRIEAKVVNEQSGNQKVIEGITVTGETVAGSYSGSTSLSGVYAGLNIFRVTAIDPSDNYISKSIQFFYDMVAPEIEEVVIYGEEWYKGEKEFNEITLDQSIIRHLEFGHRMKLEIYANDEEYMDPNGLLGEDVNATAKVLNSQAQELVSTNLIYDNESESYYAIVETLFDLGTYSVVFEVKDKWGNKAEYVTSFYVNDTVEPFFEIRIIDSSGKNVTEVAYGTYTIEIIPSEPIKKLEYLNYTVTGIMKYISLFEESGTFMKGSLVISHNDLDLINLRHELAEFLIYGEDLHDKIGTKILIGEEFYISTTGPMQPIILTPDTSSETTFFIPESSYNIEGIVYKEDNKGLRNGRAVLMKNTVFGDYADGNWVNAGETQTTTNSINYSWDYRLYDDQITYKAQNRINIHDYDDYFQTGRFIEFANHLMPNRKLYRITGRTFSHQEGPKLFYELTLDPDLGYGFEGMVPGDKFQDIVNVYDHDAPDGWFNFPASVGSGNNYFYALAYDGPNEGEKSVIFNLLKDDLNPVLINTSPIDGTRTGFRQIPIYAWVDPTLSEVSNYIMKLNGEEIGADISYNEQGYAKIEYPYSGDLLNGTYSVNLIVQDMALNTLNHVWGFEIDYSMPNGVGILPSGPIQETMPLVQITFFQSDGEILLDEVLLEGEEVGYFVNLTEKLNRNGLTYTYQLTPEESLVEGAYTITVHARRKIGDTYGNQGQFIGGFVVDVSPPIITQVDVADSNPYIPVRFGVTTNEEANCRYSFDDVDYDNMEYSSDMPGFHTDNVFHVFELQDLTTLIYAKCADEAGNKMLHPEIIEINVESLLFPAPGIIVPENSVESTSASPYMVIGSTFDSPDPAAWVPDINVVIGRSSNLYTPGAEFEDKFTTTSFSESEFDVVDNGASFFLSAIENSIIIKDSAGFLRPNRYVEFPHDRKPDYTFYEIKSIIHLAGSYGEDMVKVIFEDQLPQDLDTNQLLLVHDQNAPGGWFKYDIGLQQGANFVYAAGLSSVGEGARSDIYNIIMDNSNPVLYDEFPRNGEIISEETLDVSVVADGISSEIERADFRLDSIIRSPTIQLIKDHESLISFSMTLANGLHGVDVTAFDQAGNSGRKQWSFTIDASVPKRPSIYPNIPTNNTMPLVEIGFQELVVVKTAKIKGGSFNHDFTNNLETSDHMNFEYKVTNDMPEGEYTIEVRAQKSEILEGSIGLWYDYFEIDLTPPTITSIPSEIVSTDVPPVSFLMITNEDAICRYSENLDTDYQKMSGVIDDDGIAKKIHYVSIHTSTSKLNLYIRCKDIAGNAMQNSEIVKVNEGIITPGSCGDGVIRPPEECDGGNWGGIRSCTDYNPDFAGGTLVCDPDSCRLDTTECVNCVNPWDCGEGDWECIDGICVMPHCFNGIEDGDEEDVDCGGSCPPCDEPGHCFNGILDGDEDDVDCGGSCRPCHCFNGVEDGDEEGVDCGGECAPCAKECGNNKVESGETCDGTDWGDITECHDLDIAFTQGQGTLACNPATCHFDTSGCASLPECNNGILEPGEECEIDQIPSCENLGPGGGEVQCIDCHLDTTGCSYLCGNGIIEPGEECDGGLDGKVCSDFDNFFGEGLACIGCFFDTSSCQKIVECGDGIIDPGEHCDSSLDGKSCTNFDDFIPRGTLRCDDCQFNTSGCEKATECDNGIVEPGEQCETDVQFNCSWFGLSGSGFVVCENCLYNYDQCGLPPGGSCGDGVLNQGEQCEPGDLATCEDYGLIGGDILCDPVGCFFDTSGCEIGDSVCGNGIIESGEHCEGSNLDGKDCTFFDNFNGGRLECDMYTCQFITSGCAKSSICGNGVIELGEDCDGGLDGKTCSDFDSFTGDGLDCTNCNFDTSNCIGIGAECGNGVIEPGESCDGMTLPYSTCEEYSTDFVSGLLFCSDNCQIDTSSCQLSEATCNNGILEPGEECDTGVGDSKCKDFDDFKYGSLGCTDLCLFDTTNCDLGPDDPVCGDGMTQPGEQCDKAKPTEVPCSYFDDFVFGDVLCDEQCKYLFSECSKELPQPGCGNHYIDPGLDEECDGDIILRTCRDLGFSVDGNPECFPPGYQDECKYDTSPCGSAFECQSSEKISCNLLNPAYVYGEAVCQGNFYDVSYCFTGNHPIIEGVPDYGTIESSHVTIYGTVTNARKIEIYINDNFVDEMEFTRSTAQQFRFEDVYLPNSQSTGDGKNYVKLIAYGGMLDRTTEYEVVIIVIDDEFGIILIDPVMLMVKSETPIIIIETTREAICEITYTSGGDQYTQAFSTENMLSHSIQIENPLSSAAPNPITIECLDLFDNLMTLDEEINVDTSRPDIIDVGIRGYYSVIEKTSNFKHILIYQELDNTLVADVDSLSRCRYIVDDDMVHEYSDMIDYDSTVTYYLNYWESNQKIKSGENLTSIYTICEDEAGWTSDEHHLLAELSDQVLKIKNNNPPYVNNPEPNLYFKTNLPAECELSYEGKTKSLPRIPDEQNYEYPYEYIINAREFKLTMKDSHTYKFTISCTLEDNPEGIPAVMEDIEVGVDLVPPKVTITSPTNNQVFQIQIIKVEAFTEKLSVAELLVNGQSQGTLSTPSGALVFDASLTNGYNSLTVHVTDKASNTNYSDVDVYYAGSDCSMPHVIEVFPERDMTVSIINRTFAYIKTCYGANLDLSKTKINLVDQSGNRIPGEMVFTPGSAEEEWVGTLIYKVDADYLDGNTLPEAIYYWDVSPVDEFGQGGLTYASKFIVDSTKPRIIITNPIELDSDLPTRGVVYHTNEHSFGLVGSVVSLLAVSNEDAYYQMNSGSGFGEENPLDLINYKFNKNVVLDDMGPGKERTDVLRIYVKNSDGFHAELSFDILYDLKSPEIEEIIIE